MEKLRDTQSYVYSLTDLIGKGATCEVYKGINKESGQIRALKIFESRLRGVAHRELEALRSLKHDNIVEFVGEETDSGTGRVVAVMEYCDKSLYNMLCESQNRNGITEDEFLRFFRHTVEGMKHLREHGFLHRDIKPGNILLAQDDDGSYIYKLSDFGTAKPVLESEAFQSLVGTEEYLHPNIFKAAFIDQGMTREFDAAADLWSLGATLYHAATGKVPFRPYQGRNDRMLMFKMLTQKEHGVIAGEQTSREGQVHWSRELPTTCRMSRWFKQTLTELLARLMETDRLKACSFEQFFSVAENILSYRVEYMFSTTTARHFRLYMKPDSVFKDLQTAIQEETGISPKDQLIIYEECFLKDIVKETDQLTAYPTPSEENPFVLIQSTTEQAYTPPDEGTLWYNTFKVGDTLTFAADDRPHFTEDVRLGNLICERLAMIDYMISQGCLAQRLFEKTVRRTERWKDILINRFQTEVDLYRDRVKDLRHIHKAIMVNSGIECLTPANGVNMEDDLRHIHKAIMVNGGIECLTPANGVNMEDLINIHEVLGEGSETHTQSYHGERGIQCLTPNNSINIEDLKNKANSCSRSMDMIRAAQTDDGRQLYKAACVEGNNCQKKIARLLLLGKSKLEDMEKRKQCKRSVLAHEMKLHKFDKSEMTTLLIKASELWGNHCKGKMVLIHNHFLQWHRAFTKLQCQIEQLQKEIRAMKSAIKNYTRNFKVDTPVCSMMESFDMDSEEPTTPTTPAPTGGLDPRSQDLAENLLHQLNYVKLGQAEMRSLVNESDEVYKQSMDLMSDLSTMTSESSAASN